MARVAHVAVPVVVELVSGSVRVTWVGSVESVAVEEPHPANTPAPKATAAAAMARRHVALDPVGRPR